MKIFIDSAKLDEIEAAYHYGILDGVTTNPSLIKKAVDALKGKGKKKSDAKIDMEEYIKKILTTARGTPVSLEVTETTFEGMVAQGKELYKRFNPTANNVYIKIPVNTSPVCCGEGDFAGIKAIHALSKEGIPVNCTLVFTPEQALLAAKAGAKFVSPFVGRMDDHIRTNNHIHFEKTDYYPAYGWHTEGHVLEDNGIISGIDLVKQIVELFKKHNIQTEVLAASIRNPRQARESALVGAHIATLPLHVIRELLCHFKTVEGMEGFTKDLVPEYVKLTK